MTIEYPQQAIRKKKQTIWVDEHLAEILWTRAAATDRSVGWEVIEMLKAGLRLPSVAEQIPWPEAKHVVTINFLHKYLTDEEKKQLSSNAVKNHRKIGREINHLLKAVVQAERPDLMPEVTALPSHRRTYHPWSNKRTAAL